ncbi:hypothetical protein [Deinococcus rubellus]|uniref:Uncharacterized protein n=1 Tax=Deinococcus rubellus TaxID=1889240 RepID=A0ABY5YDL0_9DEIO|nr:hypothetical protein [Deinococcus rubellus]UWX63011.1 hypothetical protein N0D28_09570 [Deinococcus rubellus]
MSRPPDSGSGEGKEARRRLPPRSPEVRKTGSGENPKEGAAPDSPSTDNQLSGLLDGLSLPEQFLAAGAVQADGTEASSMPVNVAGSGEVRLTAPPQEQIGQTTPTLEAQTRSVQSPPPRQARR